MTKSELIQRLAERNPHLYQRDVERIVSTIFEEISSALARGDRVELRGFGAFSVKNREPRAGRNPRTGDHTPAARLWLGGPGVPPGLHLDRPRSVDIAPTILGLLDVPPPDIIDGRNLIG